MSPTVADMSKGPKGSHRTLVLRKLFYQFNVAFKFLKIKFKFDFKKTYPLITIIIIHFLLQNTSNLTF
jgi:hypothetical protein